MSGGGGVGGVGGGAGGGGGGAGLGGAVGMTGPGATESPTEIAKITGGAQGIEGVEQSNGIQESLLDKLKKGEIIEAEDTGMLKNPAISDGDLSTDLMDKKESQITNSLDFTDANLSEKLFDKLSEIIDKRLMLAILMAIQNEDKEELMRLLEIAFALAAMEKGSMIDIQG